MYTQEELLNALHEAGAGGRPFTLSAVRARLGLQNCDKQELERFRRRVRSLQKGSGGTLERMGNNSYRLHGALQHESAQASETQPQLTAAAPPEAPLTSVEPAQAPTRAIEATVQPMAAVQIGVSAQPANDPQPTAAARVVEGATKAAHKGLCARSLALGQRVAHFVGEHYAQRHQHAERLRDLARALQPKAEALRTVGMLQLQALRQRVSAARRHTA